MCVSEDKNNRRREFNKLVVKPCAFCIDIRNLPILCSVVAGGEQVIVLRLYCWSKFCLVEVNDDMTCIDLRLYSVK